MKKFYSTVMMLAMMVAAVGFVACGGDDEDDVLVKSDNEEVQGGSESPISIGKRLVRMSYESYIDYISNSYKDEYYTSYSTFTYDDEGRIIQIGGKDGITTNVTYDGLYIIFKGDGGHIQHTLYNGKIVESTLSMRGFGNLEVKNIYKGDYLIERTYKNSTYAVIPDYEKYFWNDGNIVKIEKEYYNSNEHGETIIEYSKHKDYNGFISSIISDDVEEIFSLIGTVGYLGKCSTNLPLKNISTTYTSDGYATIIVETNYDWEVENDFPIKVTINRDSNGHIKNYKKISTYIFEWE